ncbi:hypothetical protein Hamer_G006232 [Homarus americanus]|uniref:Uncharacterized protein n=1 Tax=Homarus americanus TaxID=6706 RepID=A0A8J5JQA7_HOMAM|nr:hypothetical protein Hamer_G006232 [Homarus americanus]
MVDQGHPVSHHAGPGPLCVITQGHGGPRPPRPQQTKATHSQRAGPQWTRATEGSLGVSMALAPGRPPPLLTENNHVEEHPGAVAEDRSL